MDYLIMLVRRSLQTYHHMEESATWSLSLRMSVLAGLLRIQVDIFLACTQHSRLSLSQLKAILTHLGYSDTPDTNTDVAEGKIATIVKNYLQDWKEKNVSLISSKVNTLLPDCVAGQPGHLGGVSLCPQDGRRGPGQYCHGDYQQYFQLKLWHCSLLHQLTMITF